MGTNWQSVLFEDAPLQIEDGDRGKNYPKKTEFMESGHCIFLNTGNVTRSGFDLTELDFISKERDDLLRKGKLKRYDIVLTTRGTVGNVAYFDDGIPFDHIRINSGMVIIRPDRDVLDPRFIYLYLRSRLFTSQVEALTTGSAQPQLPIRDINKIQLIFPDLSEQKAIANILGSLDDKIELNRQMNATLEAIAQALFKSWFVDFDPVIDNAIAANNPIPESFQARAAARQALGDKRKPLHPEIQQQFGDRFTFNEDLGWVPEGWEASPLDKIAQYQNGLALQNFRPENEDDFLPVVKIAQLKKGRADGEEKASPKIKRECIIDDGDIIFSWSGSLMVDIWCGGKAALNQHLFKVTSKNYPKWFFHQFTKHHLQEFQRIASDKAVTMGHIKREHLSQAYCASPDFELLKVLDDHFDSLMNRGIANRVENRQLEQLRDSLLPKLLSGQIRIPDAEILVAEVI